MITVSIKEIDKSDNISLHLRVAPETKYQLELSAKKLGYQTAGALINEITPQIYQQAFREVNNVAINT